MSVVALAEVRAVYSPPTRRLTVYCVQVYWRDRVKLARGKLLQFGSAGEALEAGRTASVKAAGVAVFRLRGFVSADYMGDQEIDPERFDKIILATYGDVPSTAT